VRETYEFRIREPLAGRVFASDEGRLVGFGVRKVRVDSRDPRLELVGETDRQVKQEGGGYFFSTWNLARGYSKRELLEAELFLLLPLVSFEPAGEECGTVYDDRHACDACSAGAERVGPLFLATNKLPKRRDVAKSIAGEVVVSQRFVDACRSAGVSGASFAAVRQKGGADLRPLGWYDLRVQPPYAQVISPTRAGVTPFDADVAGEFRCPNGDTIGLNLLTEITISRASRGEADIVATQQFVGRRGGLLRPERQILVSRKVRRILREHKISGYRLEVAHVAAP
jgi:hypothetical protein